MIVNLELDVNERLRLIWSAKRRSAMGIFMWRTFRGFFIGLFAVTLVFNGGISPVLADIQTANVHHVVAKKAEANHQKQHTDHHHGQSDDATAALDEMPAHDHPDGNAKCCTMCITFDNVVPAFAGNVFRFRHRIADFRIDRQLLIGHPVALDPDIPKTIV